MIVVYLYPDQRSGEGEGSFHFILVLAVSILTSFSSTIMFVCAGAFFARIGDPVIGGTYMTLLNTLSNFGGTWPKWFVLNSIDPLTRRTCSEPNALVGERNVSGAMASISEKGKGPLFLCRARSHPRPDVFIFPKGVSCERDMDCATTADPCTTPEDCFGRCDIDLDGYYIVGWTLAVVGAFLLYFIISPKSHHLQRLPESAWRIAGSSLKR